MAKLIQQSKEKLMNEAILTLVTKAFKNKEVLSSLKNLVVKHQMYSVGADLLEIERELYPEREKTIKVQKEGRNLSVAFGMSGVNVDPKLSWILHETSKLIIEKAGNFDIGDSSKIQGLAEEHFGK